MSIYVYAGFNSAKALEVILWLTNRRAPADIYRLLMMIYFADKKHLNEYGRPVVGDVYDPGNYGPVARSVYLMLTHDPLEDQACGGLPFSTQGCLVTPDRQPNKRLMSMTDEGVLEWAWQAYSDMPFAELERLSCAETAWRNARERGGPLNLDDLRHTMTSP